MRIAGEPIKIKSTCLMSNDWTGGYIYGRLYKESKHYFWVVCPSGLLICTKRSEVDFIDSFNDLRFLEWHESYSNSPYYPYLIKLNGKYIINHEEDAKQLGRKLIML